MRRDAGLGDATYNNGSVDNALLILETLAGADGPLSLARLVSDTGINKTTLFRFLSVLGRRGYVWKSAEGDGYSIGGRFFQLGEPARLSSTLRAIARGPLLELSKRVSESIQLGLLEGDKVFYCDKIECEHSLRMMTPPGLTLDAHCTALGKVMLSLRGTQEIRKLFQGRTLAARTLNTLTSYEALAAELAKIRSVGYALNNEEFEVGLRCVAVAVTSAGMMRDVAISVSGPTFRMTNDAIVAMIPHLRTTARRIETALAEIIGRPPDGQASSQPADVTEFMPRGF